MVIDCATTPFFQLFRRIDVPHSAATPAYYVQLRQDAINQTEWMGGERPPSIYALDCANPLSVLWDGWTSGQPAEVLERLALPHQCRSSSRMGPESRNRPAHPFLRHQSELSSRVARESADGHTDRRRPHECRGWPVLCAHEF